MNKKIIFTALLALIAFTAFGQTKTAIIKGYSPALKDSTLAIVFIDNAYAASDTVMDGRFKLVVPVEKLTECEILLMGDDCPNYVKTVFIAPDAVISITGEDCLYPTWAVESPLPEQATANRVAAHTDDALKEFLRLVMADAPYEQQDSVYMEVVKRKMDILPSLPIDAAALAELTSVSSFASYVNNKKAFPYMEQLKALEKDYAARAPKGFESELDYIHSLIYPLRVLQVGEEAIDADFFDMQNNPHHLAELRGRYVLLDFWSLGCGPCRIAEPEMRQAYESLNGQLEIVGINMDKPSVWQKDEWSKKLVWQNWSDGKMGKSGIESRYCDYRAVPYYVLLSPDLRVVWKSTGYGLGFFLGMAAALNGPSQDNSANLSLAVREVSAKPDGTTVSFRYYGRENYWFRIVGTSYITADGKKYKLTAADGVTLDVENYPTEKASTATDDVLGSIRYTDFTLTFEPFDELPTSFDFIEGDIENAFVIRNILLAK